ncbi:MAG: methylenetetrahydrofolate reductase C-terminal domain-containing protein [Rhizobiales bacterium]|nr:methylenetetrahydrofolate reductase C-terminal domain-containing protein [Hyphomicrobiales bacterium]
MPAIRNPAAYEPQGRAPRPARKGGLPAWSVRHARFLARLYAVSCAAVNFSAPLLRRIGLERLEGAAALLERETKGRFFDCRMCGQCVLSATGMSCPMNCPKALRNGPCGGVRPDGGCEIYPEMTCVWVRAWEGAQRMQAEDAILQVQTPIDHRRKGASAWLALLRPIGGKP